MTPEDQAHKQIILDFIKTQRIGVVCTVTTEGLPQAASLAVSQTDSLELIFQTPNTTRKYANLQHDQHVAVVFGWSQDDYITVQYEGVAREVTDADERAKLTKIHVAKNPASGAYADVAENKFFFVTPTAVRYTQLTTGKKFVLDFSND